MAPYTHTLLDIGSTSLTMMTMMKYVFLTGYNDVDTWKIWAQNNRSRLLLSSPLLFSPLLSSSLLSSSSPKYWIGYISIYIIHP